jgi:hypothetical protein
MEQTMNKSAEYPEKTIQAEFPIESQTSIVDKRILLGLREILRDCPSYSYAEIGSYLGGSLTPFLCDPQCTSILSIDDRGRNQPDERGTTFDYSGISHNTMISTLLSHGLSVDKIEVFDGSISAYPGGDSQYDFLFIDGEHTDFACFRDFIHGMRLVKKDAIIAFHDSRLIWKSLKIIQEYLNSTRMRYEFYRAAGSQISLILLGSYASIDVSSHFKVAPNLERFYLKSDLWLLQTNAKNRLDTRSLAKILLSRIAVKSRRQISRVGSPIRDQMRR